MEPPLNPQRLKSFRNTYRSVSVYFCVSRRPASKVRKNC